MNYDNQNAISRWTQKFLAGDWIISHKTPILRCPMPPRKISIVSKAVLLVLEGLMTYMLSAFYTTQNADYGVEGLALWPLHRRSHFGLCSHSPLSEGVTDILHELDDETVKAALDQQKATRNRNSKNFFQSDKGKAVKKRYAQSEEAKAVKKAYSKRNDTIEKARAYRQSDRGKENMRRRQKSEANKETRRRWLDSEVGKASRKRTYEKSKIKKLQKKLH